MAWQLLAVDNSVGHELRPRGPAVEDDGAIEVKDGSWKEALELELRHHGHEDLLPWSGLALSRSTSGFRSRSFPSRVAATCCLSLGRIFGK